MYISDNEYSDEDIFKVTMHLTLLDNVTNYNNYNNIIGNIQSKIILYASQFNISLKIITSGNSCCEFISTMDKKDELHILFTSYIANLQYHFRAESITITMSYHKNISGVKLNIFNDKNVKYT
jgi:hypothetical protein